MTILALHPSGGYAVMFSVLKTFDIKNQKQYGASKSGFGGFMRFFIAFVSFVLFSFSLVCSSNDVVFIRCESNTNDEFFHALTLETTKSNPTVIQNLTLTTYYGEEEASQTFKNLTAEIKESAYSFKLGTATILRLPNASYSTGVYTEIKTSFIASLIEIFETYRTLSSLACTPQPVDQQSAFVSLQEAVRRGWVLPPQTNFPAPDPSTLEEYTVLLTKNRGDLPSKPNQLESMSDPNKILLRYLPGNKDGLNGYFVLDKTDIEAIAQQ